MDKIVIEKLDASCRQLNTAIALWFNDEDPVSIHTLACSAYQIVHDMNEKRGGRDLIYNSLLVKDEYRREANKLLKGAYNFFKHADKDAFGTIEFHPRTNKLFMIFTSMGLESLGCKPDLIRSAFNVYYFLNHPDQLTERGKLELRNKMSEEIRKGLLELSKIDFYQSYISQREQYLKNTEQPHLQGPGDETPPGL